MILILFCVVKIKKVNRKQNNMDRMEVDIAEERVCVKCGDRDSIDQLDQFGALWNEASNRTRPLQILIY